MNDYKYWFKKPLKNIQVVKWIGKNPLRIRGHFCFIKGNPLKKPAAFHLIYKWSLWLGFIEIRKFMTTEEMENALKIYHENY